jgi:protein-S-isoprenylcysteine O-methyltransferase Ste14
VNANEHPYHTVTTLALFLIVSAIFIYYSWPSLRSRNTHGFYRFFAFESILVLVLSNTDRWFLDPWSAHQIGSWFLLACSLLLAIHGFYLLRVIGRPERNFEQTTKLVTVGAYRCIRHPLYSSLLVLTWGIFCKDLSLLGLLLAGNSTLFLFATARMEESENLAHFGELYESYKKSTRMFIPFFF